MRERDHLAGDVVLHPMPMGAILVLLVNDHWLKSEWGHVITGKLSDAAGLMFFPLLLVAVIELAQAVLGRYAQPSRRVLVGATIATGTVFASIQVISLATASYQLALGGLQHPILAIEALMARDLAQLPAIAATPDLSDIMALPVLFIAYKIGGTRCRRRGSHLA